MGNSQAKLEQVKALHDFLVDEVKVLESFQEIIFNLNEDNMIDSVDKIMDMFNLDFSPYPNYTLSKLIYSSFVSQKKDFNIYVNFLNKIETKEKELNKSNQDKLINVFANYILIINSQESYFLLAKLIEMNLISKI